MSKRSKTTIHPRWPTVSVATNLPNVAGSPTQSTDLEVGDEAYNTGDGLLYVCTNATVGAAVYAAAGGTGNVRDIADIIVGQSAGTGYTDTIDTADYLDTGSGQQLAAAIAAANALATPTRGVTLRIRPCNIFMDPFLTTLPIQVSQDVSIVGSGNATRITVPTGAGGKKQALFEWAAGGGVTGECKDMLIVVPAPVAGVVASTGVLRSVGTMTFENITMRVDRAGVALATLRGISLEIPQAFASSAVARARKNTIIYISNAAANDGFVGIYGTVPDAASPFAVGFDMRIEETTISNGMNGIKVANVPCATVRGVTHQGAAGASVSLVHNTPGVDYMDGASVLDVSSVCSQTTGLGSFAAVELLVNAGAQSQDWTISDIVVRVPESNTGNTVDGVRITADGNPTALLDTSISNVTRIQQSGSAGTGVGVRLVETGFAILANTSINGVLVRNVPAVDATALSGSYFIVSNVTGEVRGSSNANGVVTGTKSTVTSTSSGLIAPNVSSGAAEVLGSPMAITVGFDVPWTSFAGTGVGQLNSTTFRLLAYHTYEIEYQFHMSGQPSGTQHTFDLVDTSNVILALSQFAMYAPPQSTLSNVPTPIGYGRIKPTTSFDIKVRCTAITGSTTGQIQSGFISIREVA